MRRFLPSLLAVAIVVVFSVFQRELLGDIFQRLRGVHPLEVVPLTLAGIGMIVARGFFLKSCSPGISLRQSITADQSALAAGYGIALGGGAVGTGLRIHMFTRWGMSSQVIGASIVATAVVPSFTTWGLPIVVLTPTAITSSLELSPLCFGGLHSCDHLCSQWLVALAFVFKMFSCVESLLVSGDLENSSKRHNPITSPMNFASVFGHC